MIKFIKFIKILYNIYYYIPNKYKNNIANSSIAIVKQIKITYTMMETGSSVYNLKKSIDRIKTKLSNYIRFKAFTFMLFLLTHRNRYFIISISIIVLFRIISAYFHPEFVFILDVVDGDFFDTKGTNTGGPSPNLPNDNSHLICSNPELDRKYGDSGDESNNHFRKYDPVERETYDLASEQHDEDFNIYTVLQTKDDHFCCNEMCAKDEFKEIKSIADMAVEEGQKYKKTLGVRCDNNHYKIDLNKENPAYHEILSSKTNEEESAWIVTKRRTKSMYYLQMCVRRFKRFKSKPYLNSRFSRINPDYIKNKPFCGPNSKCYGVERMERNIRGSLNRTANYIMRTDNACYTRNLKSNEYHPEMLTKLNEIDLNLLMKAYKITTNCRATQGGYQRPCEVISKFRGFQKFREGPF